MKHKFMIVLRTQSDAGSIYYGDMFFTTQAGMTEDVLREAKRQFCEHMVNDNQIKCSIENTVIITVVPLEA